MVRIFNFAIRERYRENNPTTGFTQLDAGGTERPRTRWLDCDQLAELATSMRETENFGRINELSAWLLLYAYARWNCYPRRRLPLTFNGANGHS